MPLIMVSPNQSYEVLQAPQSGRLRLVLRGEFDSEVRRTLEVNGITSVLLSQRLGWKRQGLAFLKNCPNLSELIISDDGIDDLTAVSGLVSLERVLLECPSARMGPDFTDLPRLKDARVDWRECYRSLLACATLEGLLIDGFSEQDLSAFELPALTELRLLRARKLQTLNGISRLPRLRRVAIVQCPSLKAVSDVEGTSLESLEIEACMKAADLDRVFRISTLNSIVVERCADIQTIAGVSSLPLRNVRLVDVNIVDGNMRELQDLGSAHVFFTNKRHYTHKMRYSRKLGRFEMVHSP
jgi:hypothetical protein